MITEYIYFNLEFWLLLYILPVFSYFSDFINIFLITDDYIFAELFHLYLLRNCFKQATRIRFFFNGNVVFFSSRSFSNGLKNDSPHLTYCINDKTMKKTE